MVYRIRAFHLRGSYDVASSVALNTSRISCNPDSGIRRAPFAAPR